MRVFGASCASASYAAPRPAYVQDAGGPHQQRLESTKPSHCHAAGLRGLW